MHLYTMTGIPRVHYIQYALRVLRDHGLPASSLEDVLPVFFRATIFVKIRYCAPVMWSGLCSASDRARLDAFLRRSKKYGYCADDVPTTVSDLFAATDQSLFKRVLKQRTSRAPAAAARQDYQYCYKLRPRKHDRQLIRKSAHLNDSSFVVRMLYQDSY